MKELSTKNIKVIINSVGLNAYRLRKYCYMQNLILNNLAGIYSCIDCSYNKICNKYLRLK